MIYYDNMKEGWSDEEDINFFIDMSPEGDDGYEFEFETKEDFYNWYYNDIIKGD